MKNYNHKKIEKKTQKFWIKNNIFKSEINNKKKKYYCLCMLPYPSGKLHMGHVRNYIIGDIISRYKRLKNKNVLHPIGWDSFGLPAENAAIENNISPYKWTKKNIKYMKKQLKSLGISYDWNREINTCKSSYYKWEQWLFLKLFKKKLVYKKKDIVNWCPKDKTVLANEQVINNKCWRCNSITKYKKISQWYIKITKYANKLLNDLKKLKNWPKKIIKMQKKWIGKSKGLEIIFYIKKIKKKIKIFTSKIEFLSFTTCISISPHHKIIKKIKKYNPNLKKKIKNIFNNDKNKCNGIYTNIYTINPINKKILPIWITNFTEEIYNTKAILIIPYIYKKHNIFIKKYKIKIKKKINKEYIKKNKKKIKKKNKKIIFKLKIAKKKINFKLKDWVISRQRYWGVPIPIIIKNKKYKTIPENNLPIKLKKNKFSINNFKKKKLKTILINNKKITIEKDTFDTFMESSWYYARYTSPKYKLGIFNKKEANYWLPIDIYIGGIEHATMHLIYFRFIHKFLKDIKLLKSNEPAKKIICQGMVLSDTYFYIKNKKKYWISFKKVIKKKINKKTEYFVKNKNIKLTYAGKNKMSKSKNNGIDPTKIIKKYGTDTLRLFIIFSAPIEKNLHWNESNIIGCYRFLNKLWKLVFNLKKINLLKYKNKKKEKKKQNNILYYLNKNILEINNNLSSKNKLNTSISKIMKLTNIINKYKINNEKDFFLKKMCINKILILIYPFTPHISFYLWKKMKNKNMIHETSWPKPKKKYINIKIKIIIALQINGKTKKKFLIKNTYNQNKIINIILKKNLLNNYLTSKKYINKIIYIKNKIINFVIKNKKNEKKN